MPHLITTLPTSKLRLNNTYKSLVQHLVRSSNSILAIIIVAMVLMLTQPSREEAGDYCL